MTGEGDSGIVPQKINAYQGKGERRGKSSPVFGNKNARQTPLGARLNREDIA